MLPRLKYIVVILWSIVCADISAQNLVLPDSVLREADDFFFEGHRQKLLGHMDAAYELFAHSLELNPESPPTLYEIAMINMQLNKDSLATDQLKKAVRLAPDNYWYRETLATSYNKANDIENAVAVLEEMSVKYPGNTEVLGILEALYNRKQDYKNVIKTLDKIELIEGKSEQLSIEKFRTYFQMKDEESAYKEMRDLADEYPNDLRYRVMMGDLLMDDKKFDEALKEYKEVEKIDPDNIDLQLGLTRYYSAIQNDSLYQMQVEKVVTLPQMEYQRRLILINSLAAQNIEEKGDTTRMMQLLRKTLKCPQQDGRLAELCVRYMIQQDAPVDDIKPVLHQMLEIDPENVLARNQLLQYAVEANDTMGVVKVCKAAVDYSIDDPVFYYYLGIAYFQQDSTALALDALKKCLTHIKDNSNIALIVNSYALIGDLYHTLGKDKEAFEAYDTCLIYRPEEEMVLNNYAYYLSLNKKDLAKAEKMSALSLAKDSTNYTYIDTYAWILFQQKKYKEAKIYIDNAINIMLNDTTLSSLDANIFEHAGDIYSKCGLTEKAVEYWQKALLLGTDQTVIIEKKIKKRKYLE